MDICMLGCALNWKNTLSGTLKENIEKPWFVAVMTSHVLEANGSWHAFENVPRPGFQKSTWSSAIPLIISSKEKTSSVENNFRHIFPLFRTQSFWHLLIMILCVKIGGEPSLLVNCLYQMLPLNHKRTTWSHLEAHLKSLSHSPFDDHRAFQLQCDCFWQPLIYLNELKHSRKMHKFWIANKKRGFLFYFKYNLLGKD